MGVSLDDVNSPYSTSEMQLMCEQGRLLFDTIYDRISTITAELKANLAAMQGNPYLLGIDSKSAARRTVRPLLHAAGLSREAATAMKNSWIIYQGLYLPKQAGARSGFDVNG